MTSEERHIRVPRTARYRVLGDPAKAEEVWFVVHGYRQLAERFVRRFEALPGAGDRRAVVAPEALSRFYVEREVGPHGPESRVGASWMTRADREHEIRDYVEYLDRVAAAVLDPPSGGSPAPRARAAPLDGGGRRVVVLGFSQGAETASRWAVYGRIRPDELVLWGGGVATDLAEAPAREALSAAAVRLVVGTEDRWGERRAGETERWLRRLGVGSERLEYDGGHRIDPEALKSGWP